MRLRRAFTAAVIASSALVLVGCTSSPSPGPEETPQASASAEPTFVPGGTAAQNKPWFDHVNQQTLSANEKASSHEMVDALAAAGFDKRAMEVTFDRTNVDLEADYIIVSVKIGDECLIGQRGPRGYRSEIAAPIGAGTCLLGRTQPIDW